VGVGRSQQAGNLTQFGTGLAKDCGHSIRALTGVNRKRQRGLRLALRLVMAVKLLKCLTGAGERVPLGVNELLDLQDQLDIAPAVKPLAGSALVGLELRELRLPKTQNVGFDLADARNVSNLEVETVGDQGRVEGALLGELRGHSQDKEESATMRELSLNAV
jgi:hypothetical protein